MKRLILHFILLILISCSSSPTETKIQAPIVQNISATTSEDNSVLIIFNGNDPQGLSLTYSLKSSPSNGTFTKNNSSGRYFPNENFSGMDSFSYSAFNGNLESNIGQISINIFPVDDDPNSIDKNITTDEDTSIDITLEAEEYDGDAIIFYIKKSPLNGTVTLSNEIATYLPNENYFGTDFFTFEAVDSSSKSIVNEATVHIIVNPINDKPEVNDFTVEGLKNQNLIIELHGNDVDGDELTFSIIDSPELGTANIEGNILTYSPNEIGNDVLTYQASDGYLNSESGTISVKIDWELLTFESSNNTRGYSLINTIDNGFLIGGSSYLGIRGGDDNLFILKINSLLEKEFENNFKNWSLPYFGEEDIRKIIQADDGGYFLIGSANVEAADRDSDFVVIKVDSQGNELWTKVYGGIKNDEAYSAIKSKDGNLIIVGRTYNYGVFEEDAWRINPNVYVVKIDQNGNEIWSNAYGSMWQDVGYSIVETVDGSFIITGFSNTLSGGVYSNSMILKIDNLGNEVLFSSINVGDLSYSYSIENSLNGNYFIASNQGPLDFSNINLSEVDIDGNEMWTKNFNVDFMGVVNDIVLSDNSCFLIGYKRSSFKNNDDILVIKTDLLGNKIWEKSYGGDLNEYGQEGIFIDNNLIIVGYSKSKTFNSITGKADKEDIVLIKINDEGNRIF